MTGLSPQFKAAATIHLLDINQAIDRASLIRKIADLGESLRLIEAMPNQSNRAEILREEISSLKCQLEVLRERVL